ncbi:hypothetical protein [Pararobbsia alpina]|uniref:Uncharacterized protein n=1 Tax=Pararobbsia alpina TaxID=621374 RepID=A0A6S7B643_9BURK|nr:hypothetical protein [Pararobbsia alpina]CAB3778938.1 hypothetical protein LMG28138_00706 [Pararobbsia alpina]
MFETISAARCRRRAFWRIVVASMIALVVMTVPLNAKACADHAGVSPETHLNVPPDQPSSGLHAETNTSRYDPAYRNVFDPPELEDSRRSPPPVRARSIDENSPNPFGKRFPPPRAADPREQPLLDHANRSMSRSIFEMPGQMSDTQRDDPRRTGRLEWTSPLPLAPDPLGKRLRERDGDPDTH